MGFMTLDNFRTDVQSALGNKGFPNANLDRWINFGYLDLCGAVDFEVLDAEDISQSTAIGSANLTTPTGTMAVKIVRNTTDDTLLGWKPKQEFYRRNFVTTGSPEIWTRHGANIKLNPTPSAIKAMLIIYKKPPTLFTTSSQASVLPDIWDIAIFQLATHHGLLASGEDQRASTWLARAITYIQSRMTEQDLQQDAPGLGATLPIGIHRLMARMGPEAAQVG